MNAFKDAIAKSGNTENPLKFVSNEKGLAGYFIWYVFLKTNQKHTVACHGQGYIRRRKT